MIRSGLPALYTLFLWWFSTGAIFYLDSRPAHTFRWSMTGATALMIGAVFGLTRASTDTTVAGAYAAFTIGLALWGWLELGYYMGFMIGPRRAASPPGCSGWRHFCNAAGTTLYHEAAALALAALIGAVTWDSPNTIAFWTFVILWWMQLSAKLNVFLGVPNLAEEFLPAHLAFLRSFMTRKAMNLFFPVSITVSTVIATMMVGHALGGQATRFEATGLAMLSTLMILAVLEHWFLVVPVPVEALWRWSLRIGKGLQGGRGAAPAPSRDGAPEIVSHTRVAPGFSDPGLTRPVTP